MAFFSQYFDPFVQVVVHRNKNFPFFHKKPPILKEIIPNRINYFNAKGYHTNNYKKSKGPTEKTQAIRSKDTRGFHCKTSKVEFFSYNSILSYYVNTKDILLMYYKGYQTLINFFDLIYPCVSVIDGTDIQIY